MLLRTSFTFLLSELFSSMPFSIIYLSLLHTFFRSSMYSLLSFLISSLCNPSFHFISSSLSIYSLLSFYPFSFLPLFYLSLFLFFPPPYYLPLCFPSSKPLLLFLSLSPTLAAPSPLHTSLLLSCLSTILFLLTSTEQIRQSFSEVSSSEGILIASHASCPPCVSVCV